jgi:hypothetical protein
VRGRPRGRWDRPGWLADQRGLGFTRRAQRVGSWSGQWGCDAGLGDAFVGRFGFDRPELREGLVVAATGFGLVASSQAGLFRRIEEAPRASLGAIERDRLEVERLVEPFQGGDFLVDGFEELGASLGLRNFLVKVFRLVIDLDRVGELAPDAPGMLTDG